MISFQLGSEIERLVQQKAARRGQSLEAFLQGLAEREAYRPDTTDRSIAETSATDSWVECWRAWAQGHPATAIVADHSRESLYGGRSE
jgi:hypothetical protein